MEINPDEDTEFNDALRKYGILPPKPESPRTLSPPPSPTLEELLEDYEPHQLRERAEDARDDDEARAIEAYRRKRIGEIQLEQRRVRFGRVYPIGRDDYTREVTDASKVDEEGEGMAGKGTGVVCFLYKDGHIPSERAFSHIRTLASRHPRTKFVSIVGDKCIPNYPDRHLPTFFLYREGEIVDQQVAWAVDRDRGLEDLEALLIGCGVVIPSGSDLPRAGQKVSQIDGDDDDLSDSEAFPRSSVARTNVRAPKNIRDSDPKSGDSDSDFDL